MNQTDLARWCSEGLFDGPVETAKSVPKRALLYSEDCGPLSEMVGLPAERYALVRSRVLRLLRARYPAAIRGLVIAVWVYAVKRVIPRRSLAHIVAEALETRPALADCYSSAAVIVKGVMSRIQAALPHVNPAAIYPRCFLIEPMTAIGVCSCLCRVMLSKPHGLAL